MFEDVMRWFAPESDEQNDLNPVSQSKAVREMIASSICLVYATINPRRYFDRRGETMDQSPVPDVPRLRVNPFDA